MKIPKTQLLDGESLIIESGGGPASFLGAKGGHVYLTNKRLFHESLIGSKLTFSINLDEIVQCEKVRWSNLVCLIPLMKCLKIFRKDGSSTRFNIADKDGWVVAIRNAVAA
jgi:hypothetical protein